MLSFFKSQRFSRKDVVSVLVFLLVVAFVVRFFASSLPGHGADIGINAGWAHTGAKLGPGISYVEQLYNNILPNHPPVSIISYTLAGQFFLKFITDSEDTGLLAHSIWIRLPAIAADLVTLFLIFMMLLKWRGPSAAFLGGLIHALHPAIIVDSAIWGQIDSVFSMLIVASLFCYLKKWWVLFAVCYTLAVLSKAQALAIAPFIFYLWMYNVPWRHKIWSGIFSLVCAGIILLPFILAGTIPEVLKTYTEAVGYYSSLSMNAYNLWWLLYNDPGQPSNVDVFLSFSYREIGMFLFFFTEAYFMYLYHQFQKSPRAKKFSSEIFSLFGVATMIYLAFFVLNTEMHERYLFPAVILALPLAFWSWKFVLTYLSLSVLFLLNLLGAFGVSGLDRWLFERFTNLRTLIAFFVVLLFFYLWKLISESLYLNLNSKKVLTKK